MNPKPSPGRSGWLGRLRGLIGPDAGSASRILVALLFLGFDAMVILPSAIGCYGAKRAAHIDVFPGMDMLPDPVIERVLAGMRRQVRRYL